MCKKGMVRTTVCSTAKKLHSPLLFFLHILISQKRIDSLKKPPPLQTILLLPQLHFLVRIKKHILHVNTEPTRNTAVFARSWGEQMPVHTLVQKAAFKNFSATSSLASQNVARSINKHLQTVPNTPVSL